MNEEETLELFDNNLIEEYRKEVHEYADEIDPDDEEDWQSLLIGWAIAKGLTPDIAYKFAYYITRFTNMG